MSDGIAPALEELDQQYEMIGEPSVIPINNLRLRLVRAGLGLLCLLSMASVGISLFALFLFGDPLWGLVCGVSGVVFWLAIRIGAKFKLPEEPKRDWGTVFRDVGQTEPSD